MARSSGHSRASSFTDRISRHAGAHANSATVNCLTCHNAHGSNHNRLLSEKAPNVCQDCHDASRHPGTVYDATGGWNFRAPSTAVNTRLIARGCVNCHYHVHGSNAPAMRGKFFLR